MKKAKKYDSGGKIESESGNMIEPYADKETMGKYTAEDKLRTDVKAKNTYDKIRSKEFSDLADDDIARDGDVINNPKNYKKGGKVKKTAKKSIKAEGNKARMRLDRKMSKGKK